MGLYGVITHSHNLLGHPSGIAFNKLLAHPNNSFTQHVWAWGTFLLAYLLQGFGTPPKWQINLTWSSSYTVLVCKYMCTYVKIYTYYLQCTVCIIYTSIWNQAFSFLTSKTVFCLAETYSSNPPKRRDFVFLSEGAARVKIRPSSSSPKIFGTRGRLLPDMYMYIYIYWQLGVWFQIYTVYIYINIGNWKMRMFCSFSPFP